MIYVLCGIPASGKTTLARELAEKYDAKLHSYDDVVGANTSSNDNDMRSVYDRWIDEIKADLKENYAVVCDSTNLTANQRLKLLSVLKDFETKKILYVLTTPLEECVQRNGKRTVGNLPSFIITQSQEMFEKPTYVEGWDKIILVNNK